MTPRTVQWFNSAIGRRQKQGKRGLTSMAVKAVFLDRDGTLNVEKGYIHNVDELELYPGVAQCIRSLNDAGYLCILTTNQSGPARGYYDEDHVRALNQRVVDLLAREAGAILDAVYYCPCLPSGTVSPYNVESVNRKPNTGMIDQACQRFPEIDRAQSWVMGDKATDVAFGYRAGCQTVLLLTGYGQRVLEGQYQSLQEMEAPPTLVAADLTHAVACILAAANRPMGPADLRPEHVETSG